MRLYIAEVGDQYIVKRMPLRVAGMIFLAPMSRLTLVEAVQPAGEKRFEIYARLEPRSRKFGPTERSLGLRCQGLTLLS